MLESVPSSKNARNKPTGKTYFIFDVSICSPLIYPFRNRNDTKISHISCGPTVTRYELHPEHGVKVSRILNLQDDIKLNLAAADIRIEAPIPGKAAVGIEVPNKSYSTVMLRELRPK